MPKISQRAIDIPQSDIRKFVPLADAARKRGLKVFPLNIGQPDIKSPKLFLDELKNLELDIVAYDKSRGNDRLVEACRGYYKRTLDVDLITENIQITAGGSEGILFSLLTVCNPGDEIITFEPFFVNNIGNAYKSSIKFVPVPTVAENGFQIPLPAEIEQYITPKTKAILICNPNNPTGTAYPISVMEAYIKFAEERKLFLLVDEVYRDFIYDEDELYTVLKYRSNNVVVIDSFSKRFSLCGARLGVLLSYNLTFMDAVFRFAQTRQCSATIEQLALIPVLERIDESYLKTVKAEYKCRRDVVVGALREMPGVVSYEPEGAFYAVVKLPIGNANHFITWMLNEYSYNGSTVFVSPASGFYITPNTGLNEIRIAYVINCAELEQAMEVLKHALVEYKRLGN
ncbi:MAG: pyridoxal phosphate-dependent aminotransferase [Bacillota bacterium]